MNEMAAIENRTGCEPLLELATPYIYRRNLFRVLGVRVNATPKDVQQQQNRRKMQEKLGIASSTGHAGSLALNPPPTDEDIRAAMERLNRPIDRLLDEVFWFWPTNGNVAADPALKAIEQGQIKKASEIWMEQSKLDGQGQIAIHNLAVLDHFVALDSEARLASHGLDKSRQERLAQLWLQGFARWKQVLEGEEFWSVVKDRVRDLNDVQLTTGFVRRVRSTLPTALLLISAKIAYGAAERSDAVLAQRHIALIRQAGFDERLVDEAIREALRPIRDRIKTAIDHASSLWTGTPHHGNRFVRELNEQTASLLAIVDAILPADNLSRAALHDMVAEAMLEGQIAFGNKTNNWSECIELLALAQKLAVGDSLRSRLAENGAILQSNAKTGNDWCSPGYWDLPEETIATLEAARAETQAGNHDGAIRTLVAMDQTIGKPLWRCLAFCLSQRGAQITGQGLEVFARPTTKIQKFLDVIGRRGTVSVPSPHTPSYALPDCPCCGTSRYTRWANGEYQGQRFWMCSSCSAADDQEREKRKRDLRSCIGESLQYLILADELDPRDPGVLENLKSLKKIAADVSCGTPTTAALRKRLALSTGKRPRTPSTRKAPASASGSSRATGDQRPKKISRMLIAAAAVVLIVGWIQLNDWISGEMAQLISGRSTAPAIQPPAVAPSTVDTPQTVPEGVLANSDNEQNGTTATVPVEKPGVAAQEFVQNQTEQTKVQNTSKEALETGTAATGKQTVDGGHVKSDEGTAQQVEENGTTATVPVEKPSVGDKELVAKQTDQNTLPQRDSLKTWTDATGKQSVEAGFVGVKDGKVQLRKKDATTATVPVEKLSAADQEFVQKQTEQNAVPNKDPLRTWTDAAGKNSVKAEFVNFKDGKVQLRKENGMIATVPLEKLSAADQEFVQQQIGQITKPNRHSLRIWTDAAGKHSVKAEFVNFKDGKVQLRKENGMIATVPLEKLSAADQEFVQQQSN